MRNEGMKINTYHNTNQWFSITNTKATKMPNRSIDMRWVYPLERGEVNDQKTINFDDIWVF